QFVIAAGASADAITLNFPNSQVFVDQQGQLVISPLGPLGTQLIYSAPLAGDRGNLDAPQAHWVAFGNQASLQVDHADSRVPLYIKTILFSSFVPSFAGAAPHASAVDGAGNVYLTGRTLSPALPGEGAPDGGDIFVTKLNSGGGIAYTTYIGGAGT